MATYLSQISRCLSYHAPICRPARLLHGSCKQWKKICCNCIRWQPPQLVHILPSVPTMIHVHLYTQRSGVFIQGIQGIDAVTSSAAKPTSPIIESTPIVKSSPMVVPCTPSIPVAPIETPFSPKTTPVTMPQASPSSTPLSDPKEPLICASTEPSLEKPTVSAEPRRIKVEKNELLAPHPINLLQIRMHSDSTRNQKRSIAQASKALITEYCPKDEENADSMMEIIRIPLAYQICKERVQQPELKPFDVLISTGSIALTGSDIHVYENASRDLEGMTLGHDATGFVEKVGSSVHNLHVGDRVVMESALSCGICQYCKRGMYNICADLVYNGFLATYQSHPADLCHRLPDSVSMEEGALTHTLAMGCQACFKAQVSPTSNVLIIGTSPTAVAAAMCAKAIGAKKVTIAGTMAPSLQMINNDFELNTLHFNSNALFSEVLEAIYSNFHEWPDCAINCAITPMTMNLAVMALQPCSVCVLAECESECASFNALDVLMKNIRIIPSFRSANMYPTALQLMKSGRASLQRLIARSFSWGMLEDAFECAQHEANVGLRKIIVNNTEEMNTGGLFKKRLKNRFKKPN